MVLGDVMALSVRFEETDVWREGKEVNAEEYARATSMVAQTLSGLFVFVLVVVLMNQLIALMGDSYDRVQENYTVQARISRARVIRDMMDLYVPKSDKQTFARWIHVLRPAGHHAQSVNRNAWGGRLKAVKKTIWKAQAEIEAHLLGEMKLRLRHIEDKFDQKMNMILNRIGGNNDALARHLKKSQPGSRGKSYASEERHRYHRRRRRRRPHHL